MPSCYTSCNRLVLISGGGQRCGRAAEFMVFGRCGEMAKATEYHWQALAADVHRRTGFASYGLDPVSILAMLNTIIPAVVGWVQQCKQLRDEEVQPTVAAMHARNPDGTRARLARQCKAERLKQGKEFCQRMRLGAKQRREAMQDFKLDDANADSMADAMIQECISQTPEQFARFCGGA